MCENETRCGISWQYFCMCSFHVIYAAIFTCCFDIKLLLFFFLLLTMSDAKSCNKWAPYLLQEKHLFILRLLQKKRHTTYFYQADKNKNAPRGPHHPRPSLITCLRLKTWWKIFRSSACSWSSCRRQENKAVKADYSCVKCPVLFAVPAHRLCNRHVLLIRKYKQPCTVCELCIYWFHVVIVVYLFVNAVNNQIHIFQEFELPTSFLKSRFSNISHTFCDSLNETKKNDTVYRQVYMYVCLSIYIYVCVCVCVFKFT